LSILKSIIKARDKPKDSLSISQCVYDERVIYLNKIKFVNNC
jgi:hypothetical protein